MKKPKINAVFDKVIATFELKNDRQLADFLEFSPPVISKMRTGGLLAGAAMILSLIENACMDVTEIRQMLGDEISSSMQKRFSDKTAQRVAA